MDAVDAALLAHFQSQHGPDRTLQNVKTGNKARTEEKDNVVALQTDASIDISKTVSSSASSQNHRILSK